MCSPDPGRQWPDNHGGARGRHDVGEPVAELEPGAGERDERAERELPITRRQQIEARRARPRRRIDAERQRGQGDGKHDNRAWRVRQNTAAIRIGMVR